MNRVRPENWTAALEDEVRDALVHEPSGHDIHHALRVRNLGVQLARLTAADQDAVAAMALLHDVGHAAGRADHAANGARAASSILSRVGFPKEKVSLVVSSIEHHHWKPGNAGDPVNPPLEYQVFADADRLDALGAIGIARVFAFGGAHRRPIWDPNTSEGPASAYGLSSIHHFYDKLLQLERGMYTAPARHLAARRTLTLRVFLNTFFDEWELRDLDSLGRTDPEHSADLSGLSTTDIEESHSNMYLKSDLLS